MPVWVGPALAGASLLLTLIIWQSNRKQSREQIEVKAFTDLVATVNSLQHWQAGVDVKLGIFWQGVKFDAMSAAKILHQPHPEAEAMDALIDKYMDGRLNGKERKQLIALLEVTRDNAESSVGRQLAAAQMLRAMNQEDQLTAVQAALDSMESDRQAGLTEMGHVLDSRERKA